MSVTRTTSFSCPECDEPIDKFEVAFSVHADRCPEQREGILDGSFQSVTCKSCNKTFRFDPELAYLDFKRGQFMSAKPAKEAKEWHQAEAEAGRAFNLAYGADAPAPAQALGKGLTLRVVFGWPALREKIVLREQGIDDIDIELVKMMILRSGTSLQLSGNIELRFIDSDDETLFLAWLDSLEETHVTDLKAPRALLDEVKTADFDELRSEFDDAAYVDWNRLLVVSE